MNETRKLKNSEKVKALKEFLDSGRNKTYFTAEELTDGILHFLNVDRVSVSMQDNIPDMIYNTINNDRGNISIKQTHRHDKKHDELIELVIKSTEQSFSNKGVYGDIAGNLAIYLKEDNSRDSRLIYGTTGRLYKVVAEDKGNKIITSLSL